MEPILLFNAFVALFVVVDPVGLAPVFGGLTQGYSEAERNQIARRATLIGGVILVLFAVAGQVLLEALGIGISAFRIAGGVLLFLTALDMIFARPSGARRKSVSGSKEADDGQDIAVFPLAIPLISGPGAITTVMLYTSGESVVETILILGVLLVVLALVYLSLIFTGRIMRFFGSTGANVLARVLGVLLAALAVQLVIDGVLATLVP